MTSQWFHNCMVDDDYADALFRGLFNCLADDADALFKRLIKWLT